MKLSIQAGATSQTINVFVQDTTRSDGGGLTGLVYNSSGLTAYYAPPKAAAVQITLATLAAVTSAYASGGFKEIDATNMPGWYRLDLPDAALASGRVVSIHLQGATNMAPCVVEVELTGWNNQDAVRGGLTALPNANAGAASGLPVSSTGVLAWKKNTALAKFSWPMRDSSDHVTLKTGLTITAERSIDGAAFAGCANSAAEIGATGVYTLDLAASDLNGAVIALKFTATGADPVVVTVLTQP